MPSAGASSRARGRSSDVAVAAGSISARVAGSSGGSYAVSLDAAPIPERIWAEAVRAARGRSDPGGGSRGDGAVRPSRAPARDGAARAARPPDQGHPFELHVPRPRAIERVQARRRAGVRGRGRDRPRPCAAPALARLRSPSSRPRRAVGIRGSQARSRRHGPARAAARHRRQAPRAERHPRRRARPRRCARAGLPCVRGDRERDSAPRRVIIETWSSDSAS